MLWQRREDDLETIIAARPWLDAVPLASIEVARVLTHALAIPYLLAVPPSGNTPFPFILLPPTAQRLRAAGGSYGSYTALTLGNRHPELFRCVVSIAGVTDINLPHADANLSAADREWLTEFVGNPVDDFEELASISPAYLTPRADLPIFLAHGLQDRVVDVEHLFDDLLRFLNAQLN